MKKILTLLLVIIVLCSISACGTNEHTQSPDQQTNIKVDMDLTKLSATVISAEVYNIMSEPDKYIGKVIRISGEVASSFYEPTNTLYHFLIVYGPDRQACCNQNIEFVTADGKYPSDGTVVTLTGTFASYIEQENGVDNVYYHLNNANITTNE